MHNNYSLSLLDLIVFFPYGQLPKLYIAVTVLLLIHHPSLFDCHPSLFIHPPHELLTLYCLSS